MTPTHEEIEAIAREMWEACSPGTWETLSDKAKKPSLDEALAGTTEKSND
jgi:hypothetical protein